MSMPNALVQLQAHLTMRAERASEKCLFAATFVSVHARQTRTRSAPFSTANRARRSRSWPIGRSYSAPQQYPQVATSMRQRQSTLSRANRRQGAHRTNLQGVPQYVRSAFLESADSSPIVLFAASAAN